ncbi:MAG: hypothetical protein U5J83_17780 [Bryobacterales bacterium]|nr:hypothetical protein [Bryobacterales bacterium]
MMRLDAEQMPEAEPVALTQAGLFTSSPSFFPGGKEILYAQGSLEGRRPFRMNIANPDGAIALLALSMPLWMPTLSMDGKRIAYAHRSFDTNLWTLEINEQHQPVGQPQLVVASSRGDANPAYSPDGRWLAFDTTRSGVSEIWIAEANGRNPRRIGGFPEAMCGSPAWSPNSQWLAFDARVEQSSDIYVASIQEGIQPRRITTHAADDLLPGWSGDGAWIQFASNRTGTWQIWRIPDTGGDEQQLTTTGALFHRVAPNGDVYTTQTEGRQEDAVMRLTSDGQETPVLPPVYWYNSFDFLRSGLVYIAKPSRPNAAATVVYRDEAGRDHPVHKLRNGVGFGLSVCPDGRHITWSQQDGNSSDLMLIDDLP